MTLEQWKDSTREVRERAERIRLARAERARDVFNIAFGHNDKSFACFLYAHNWSDLPGLTATQRQACRFVKWMDDRQWESTRIADRIISRSWDRYCREVLGYKGAF